MMSSNLKDFEANLRAALAETRNARPFVCDGSPLDCTVFLVGSNPATEMKEPFWSYWQPERGFDKARWFEDYKRDRSTKPLRPGKTRRNTVSNTRKRLDWVAEEAIPCRCLETNVFSVPSEELKDLPTQSRGTEVFDLLLREIKPNILVFHGQDAEEHAEQHLGIDLTPGEWKDLSLRGRSIKAIAVPHFARGWSEERTRELGREIKQLCQATGHA